MGIRNNEDRVKQLMQQDPPPQAAVTQPEGGGLNFVVPTEFIDLPSQGKYYVEGHPLHKQDTIEIRHMTTKEEEILTSRTLLKKGIALDRVIQNVIVNKQIKVEDLLVGDKNAILVWSRIYAYGAEYRAKVTCPSCGEASEANFNLLNHTLRHPDSSEESLEDGYKQLDNGNFAVYLPKTNVVTEVKLLTSQDEAKLVRMAEQRKKKRLPNTDVSLIDQMMLFVVSLNGVENKVDVRMFLEKMPAYDSRFLRKVYEKLTPNLDLTQEFGCSECGAVSDMEVPFTPEFFWPKQ